MLQATALLYSSHNRCDYLHRAWIVQRALESLDNKTIFYLPFSMGLQDQQEYSWGTFNWYFRQFEQYGLKHSTFYYNDYLRKEDVDVFFHHLWHDQVVILGGGNTETGLERYDTLGAKHYDDPGLFRRILHERQQRGLLTVGFSAGSDQLGEYVQNAAWEPMADPTGIGLAKNIMTTLHHDHGQDDDLQHVSRTFPGCHVYGLPNDSGIAVEQGQLSSGNILQIVEMIIDNSWDLPRDGFHIKTRQGMKIKHFYNDGRSWSFAGGDRLIRVMSPNGQWQRTWIKPASAPYYDYETQSQSVFTSVDQIIAHH